MPSDHPISPVTLGRPSLWMLLRRTWRDSGPGSLAPEASFVERLMVTAMIVSAGVAIKGLCAQLGQQRTIATEIYQFSILVMLLTMGIFPPPVPLTLFLLV